MGLDTNWADLRNRLGRDGKPSSLDEALAALSATGLITIRPGTDAASESYALHPGVAEAGRSRAGPLFQDAVDAEAAAFWNTVYRQALGESRSGTVRTRWMVRAGLAAVPYFTRQRQWIHAASLLDRASALDPSRANVAAVLPAMLKIAQRVPETAGVLGRVLQYSGPSAGEVKLRAALDAAAADGTYIAAHALAGVLASLYRDSGRLAEALALFGQRSEYSQLAGFGPWTQLFEQAQRLQVEVRMGGPPMSSPRSSAASHT